MSRLGRTRAFAPDPKAPAGHGCDMPGCTAAGEYRAPKSRTALRDYHWFCLEHVRSYNAAWDFYRGMSPGEIEAQTRADTAWQRPTWPLGQVGGRAGESALRDELRRVGAELDLHRSRSRAPEVPAELREPLATLGLHWPVSLDEVKSRYKALAKLHHPDANGGDRAAEERLKTINVAYTALRGSLTEARATPQPA